MDHEFRKLRISVEDTDALNDVTMIKFISLTSNRNLISNKRRKSIWKLFVNDLVEFFSTGE